MSDFGDLLNKAYSSSEATDGDDDTILSSKTAYEHEEAEHVTPTGNTQEPEKIFGETSVNTSFIEEMEKKRQKEEVEVKEEVSVNPPSMKVVPSRTESPKVEDGNFPSRVQQNASSSLNEVSDSDRLIESVYAISEVLHRLDSKRKGDVWSFVTGRDSEEFNPVDFIKSVTKMNPAVYSVMNNLSTVLEQPERMQRLLTLMRMDEADVKMVEKFVSQYTGQDSLVELSGADFFEKLEQRVNVLYEDGDSTVKVVTEIVSLIPHS